MATGPRREPHLVLVDSPDQEIYLLPEGRTRIGRSTENDVCVRETSVSRFHCYLHRQGPEVRIYDERSQNKTRIGDRDADGQPLRDGDAIRMGRVRIIYRGPAAPLPAVSPARARRSLARRRPAASIPTAPVIIIAIAFGVGGVLSGALLVWRQDPGAGVAAVTPDTAAADRAELIRYLEDAGKRTSELERRLSELLAQRSALGREGAAPAGAVEPSDPSRDEASQAQIAALQAELAEKQRDRERVLERLRRLVPGESPGGEEEFRAPDVDPSGRGESRTGRTGATVVEKPPAVRKPRPPSEVRALVGRLIELLDDYGNLEAGAEYLEPHLGELSMTTGRPAAEGLIKVCRHAFELLADLDRNLDFLKLRNEELIRRAKRLESEDPAPPVAAGGYGPPRTNPEREKQQRLLELSAKKIQIQEDQRERLLSMRGGILAAIARCTDPEAIEYLVMRFNSENQLLIKLAIVEGLKEARARLAVPALINALSSREPDLKTAARAALAAIAGADLGDQRRPWDEWWRKSSRE